MDSSQEPKKPRKPGPRATTGRKPASDRKADSDRKPASDRKAAPDRKPGAYRKSDAEDRTSPRRSSSERPSARRQAPTDRKSGEARPPWHAEDRPYDDKARSNSPRSGRSRDERPRRDDRPERDRPRGDRPQRPGSDRPVGRPRSDDRPRRDERPQREDRPRRDDRPARERPWQDRPRRDERPEGNRPYGDKARSEHPRSERSRDERPRRDDRPERDRPRRDERPRREERQPEDRQWEDQPKQEENTAVADDIQRWYTARTFAGLENVLAGELTELGATDVLAGRRAVMFNGDESLMIRANLWCRTALNVLKKIAEFSFDDRDSFYAQMRDIPWSRFFDVSRSISITGLAHDTGVFNNTLFLAQLSKDAIADHFRDLTGERPDVDTHTPQVPIQVYVLRNRCIVSLDSSGEVLFKRGYRLQGGPAPINEVLAAGLVALSGWDEQHDFLDPMCGTATIAIEAGMKASKMAPGLSRREFGFTHWKDYDHSLFERLCEEAAQMRITPNLRILASDVSIKVLDIARQNVMRAGISGLIRVQRNDFFEFHPPARPGWLIMNPPYGQRLQEKDLASFYENIGTTLKNKYPGYRAGIISQDISGLKYVGLKPSARYPVFNGQLECRFAVYELFSGTHKDHVIATRPRRPRV